MAKNEKAEPCPGERAPVVESRIDAVVISLVSVTYRDGLPVQEQQSSPTKVFLAANPQLAAAIAGSMAARG